MEQKILDQVRAHTPLIHHLTNQVVMNFSANGLLSFGGTPIMAKYIESAPEITTKSNAVLLNMGTLTRIDIETYVKTGQTANELGIPVVFDPVGIAGSVFNKEAGKTILDNVKMDVIKGNAGEMAYLADIPWQTRGVDAIGSGDAEKVALTVAKKYGTAAVVTGEIDYIAVGKDTFKNRTGHPLLEKITGGGCLLGSIIAACLTVKADTIKKIGTAVAFYGLAAQHAANHPQVHGPGTFLPYFIDALSYDILDMKEGFSNDI
ncbi:hydroxyethylthiazole kinase [Aciduricibacillus chroicocephali]|uniref:Hydroxyethylthiazole kinase n=1 Tax=Aciduricibacillus chroicocephali TaxID=3054939 RepID=A0ABY9KYW7_9BACI|nr:hydroxyethylthiazole kinase [Bacillaceae bacterium 44XB]